LVLDSLIVLCTLVLMAVYSVKLMLIVLGFSVLFTLLRMVIFRPLQVLQQEKQVCDGKESTHFIETVRGIQSVRMLRLEGFRLQGWQHLLTDCLNRDIRIKRWDMGFNAAQLFLFGLENLLVVYFAAQLVLIQALSVGMLYAFISYKGRFNNAINTLVSQLIQWRLLRVHLERLADIVHTPAKLESLSTASPQNNSFAPAHKVELRDFSFTYNGGLPVLKGLSLTINPGELVVITGHSGNGKSTLVKCLTGLYEATSGQLLIDNLPLDNRHPQQRISAVMQDDICLSGTLIDNICGFQADIDMNRLVQCCQLACLHTTIMQLPMQYFSLLHEGGSNLSGGQRQRLYLARALYQNPALLILDEASSHLDIECEKAINTNLARLSMTRIVIAHRQETIAMAQRRFH
ncbi:MAG: ATP-binding cassette domain-containing protein, partial [Aestuariibacter sp.]|nr:ATP-binding cassette domain-containing protein [Aestuariibacter sp.]